MTTHFTACASNTSPTLVQCGTCTLNYSTSYFVALFTIVGFILSLLLRRSSRVCTFSSVDLMAVVKAHCLGYYADCGLSTVDALSSLPLDTCFTSRRSKILTAFQNPSPSWVFYLFIWFATIILACSYKELLLEQCCLLVC